MIDPIGASGLGGVGRAAGIGSQVRVDGPGVSGAVGETEKGFTELLARAIEATSEQLHRAEAVSVAGLRGQAPVQEVVEQVMAAEQGLQTAIAVRDKVVAAYLEISRMTI